MIRRPIYIIINKSHQSNDLFISEDIDYVTNYGEEAHERFDELKRFCDKTMNDEKWIYEYELYLYNDPLSCILCDSVKNYKD